MTQDPQQLPLFPSAIRLQKIEPEANQYRFYRLSTQPTLFGNWAPVRQWGRIGCYGTRRDDWYDSEGEALTALAVIAEKKERRGYRQNPEGTVSGF